MFSSIKKEDKCRICLRSENLSSIFIDDYHLQVANFADVQIRQNDGYPQCICVSCLANLETCIQFKKLSEETDRGLRETRPESPDFDIKYEFEPFDDDGFSDCLDVKIEERDSDSAEYDPYYVPNTEIFLCSVGRCEFMVDNERLLTFHLLQKHKLKDVKCTFCCLRFSKADKLTAHINEKHDGKGNLGYEVSKECHICGMRFEILAEVTRHLLTHTGPGFTCKICNKAYHSKGALKKHLFRHSKVKRFECPFCYKAFVHSTNLKTHIKIHQRRKIHECEICKRKLKSQKSLELHMLMHSENKPYKCDQCSKSFSLQCSMKSHLRMHERKRQMQQEMLDAETGQLKKVKADDQTLQCEQCGKICVGKKKLRVHKRVHIVERAFPCSICGKAFKLKHTMQVHERSHTTEHPYSCSYCGKKFKQLMYVKTHERMHTGIKPFVCEICGKGYNKKRDITNHYRTHPRIIDPTATLQNLL